MKNYVITIARGYGSGGSHIARQLSKELNIPYYDTEILTKASELSGINESFFFEANEKISKGQLVFSGRKTDYQWVIYPPQDKRYLSNENLFAYQAKVMLNLAASGSQSCIIIGKAANFVLRTFPNVLRLNIQAPIEKCVCNIMDRLVVDEKEARKAIEVTDQYRKNYYKFYTGREWLDPVAYDLSINTGTVSENDAARLIEMIVKEKFPQAFEK